MLDAAQMGTVTFDFGDRSLEAFSASCADEELWPVIQAAFPPGCSILEAGAGSGRWIKFLNDKGYDAQGIELNRRDIERFHRAYSGMTLEFGDVRALPYQDQRFDAVMSLGVLEHLIDGPETAATEMYRVLKPGGIVLFTVPHANVLFRLERIVDAVKYRLLGSNVVRSLFGRKRIEYTHTDELRRLAAIKKQANPNLPIKYLYNPSIGTDFFEYRFSCAQAAQMLTDAGLAVGEVRLILNKDRIFQVFGRVVGSADGTSPVRLNLLGRAIQWMLPSSWTAHQVLVLAQRPRSA
jgi:SAM-dependent methyltransferase